MLKKAVVTTFEIFSAHFTGEIHEELDVGRLRNRNWNPTSPECDAGVRDTLGSFIGSVGPQPLYRVALCFNNSNAACGPAFCCVCVCVGGGGGGGGGERERRIAYYVRR
jgi:hypothetical protein